MTSLTKQSKVLGRTIFVVVLKTTANRSFLVRLSGIVFPRHIWFLLENFMHEARCLILLSLSIQFFLLKFLTCCHLVLEFLLSRCDMSWSFDYSLFTHCNPAPMSVFPVDSVYWFLLHKTCLWSLNWLCLSFGYRSILWVSSSSTDPKGAFIEENSCHIMFILKSVVICFTFLAFSEEELIASNISIILNLLLLTPVP